MTLQEMSADYRAQAQVLHRRVRSLRAQLRQTEDPQGREELTRRIQILTQLRGESQDLAHHLEHYYERGYHLDGRYTI